VERGRECDEKRAKHQSSGTNEKDGGGEQDKK